MLTFGPVAETDLDAVGAFLRGVFGSPPDHPPFRRDVLRWKSIAPHPHWPGSRGYVYRDGARIVAHGCVTPIEWIGAAKITRTACVVDWAADRAAPGIGLQLYRGIAQLPGGADGGRLLDGLTGIGGSADARRVLPRAGFRQIFELPVFTRIVRPLARNLDRALDWKTPARLARDWSRAPQLPASPSGWRVQKVARFDDAVAPALPAPGRPGGIVSRRSAELLNYWLDCPAAAMEGYLATGPADLRAYFLISKLAGEARIADLGVSSADPAAWRAAAELALLAAADHPEVHTVKIAAGASLLRQVLEPLDFRIERLEPVFYWDSSKQGIEEAERSMTFAENDFFYLP